MRFAEIDLIGVYVAPISLLAVAAWLVTIALRRVVSRFGLLRYVWHRGPRVRVFRLRDRSLVRDPARREASAMTVAEFRSKRTRPTIARPSGPHQGRRRAALSGVASQ